MSHLDDNKDNVLKKDDFSKYWSSLGTPLHEDSFFFTSLRITRFGLVGGGGCGLDCPFPINA
jgi:hypothetical protein